MRILTAHFGEVEIDEEKVFFFTNGLPGLEDDKRFALVSREEGQPIRCLQSLDHWEIALPVINPFELLPSYEFDITPDDISALSIEAPEEVMTINVLVIPQNPKEMTVNLASPIIINLRNRVGRQIFLENKKYKIRTPVLELTRETLRCDNKC
jgi:flagellar assembly factor FliW